MTRESDDFCNDFADDRLFDVSIIGAGVAGLYASYCCGISGLNCVVIDSLMCLGGQCLALYPDKKVYGVPGFLDVTAKDFVSKLSDQCLSFDNELLLGNKVESISQKKDKSFIVKTNKKEIKSSFVIIATGIGDMKPLVPSNINGLSELENNSDFIQYYCMKIDLYKNRDVVIAGGGDSAVDFAINIALIAKNVTLIHRRSKFNCEESKLDILKQTKNINIKLDTEIIELKQNKVITNKDNINADYIVFCYGFIPNSTSINNLESLEIENRLIKVDINTMETSIENCYAVGDVITYPHKKKNIVPCFFEADRAVRMIKNKISQNSQISQISQNSQISINKKMIK